MCVYKLCITALYLAGTYAHTVIQFLSMLAVKIACVS